MAADQPPAPERPDANLIAAIVDHLIIAASRYPLGQPATEIAITYERPGEGMIVARLNRPDDAIVLTWERPPQGDEKYGRTIEVYRGPNDLVTFGGDDETVPF